MSTRDDLIATRDFLATHTWGQGMSYQRPGVGSYCVMEAAQAAIGSNLAVDTYAVDDNIYDRIEMVRETLTQHVDDFSVIRWNDRRNRTKAQVLALLDRTIAGLSD